MVSVIPGKEKTGFFAAKAMGSTVETNELCKHISDKCSLTGSDVKGVIEALVKEIELELAHGNSIRVGDLGIFSSYISSEVVERPEDLKPKKVYIKRIAFLPSKRIKNMMKKADFERLRDFNRRVYGIDSE